MTTRMRRMLTISAAAAAGLGAVLCGSPASAEAASGLQIEITCDVPKAEPDRQLASNSCLNYLPDGTQTFVAHVTNTSGRPQAGVTVKWTDSDAKDAHIRQRQVTCVTDAKGTCQAEIKDTNPQRGEKITVTAAVTGNTAKGYLTFK